MIFINGMQFETSLPLAQFQAALDRISNLPCFQSARLARRVLEVRDGAIRALPNTANETFVEYANYIRNSIYINYSDHGITVNARTLQVWQYGSGNTMSDQGLQRLVDQAHNNFDNLNQ